MAHIKYYGDMRELTGKNEESFEAASLSELIDIIGKKYGKPAKKAAKSSLIVADSEKVLSIRKVKLQSSSEVGFFPMCCGG
ncbi:MAG: MoaD/ThiS family protein [Oscillospiraceae bacterium]|nr:MoaD/ThiS family protein [Oscillospiraceae bacterium]